MRTFILYARKARTDNKFDLDDLPSAGRMDLVCRCITSVLFLSYQKRRNVRIFVVLNGKPKPPVAICFNENTNVYLDERSVAKLIKKSLSTRFDKEWKESNGVLISRKSFQEVIKELEGNFYILHEKGKTIKNLKNKPIFVIGDNWGMPKNDEKFALRYGEKISLGKKSYLASTCISVLNWICDKNEIN